MKKLIDYIRFPFFYNDDILEKSIDELNLSLRSQNGLKRAKIHTIGDLIENWNNLDNIKHFGVKSKKETKSALFNYNLERLNDEQMLKFLELFRYKKAKERDEYKENS